MQKFQISTRKNKKPICFVLKKTVAFYFVSAESDRIILIMANEVDESNDLDIINDNNRNDEYIHPLEHGCKDNWTWSKRDRSSETNLLDKARKKGKSQV